MDKPNVFKSSNFFLWAGDKLNIVVKDETGTAMNIGLYSESDPVNPEAGVPLPPVATAATLMLSSSFVANWGASSLATKYYLDIATDNLFSSIVAGWNNKDVGSVLAYNVTGLPVGNNTYYYRVRAYNTTGTSGQSNTITAGTIVYDDWFLPSKDEATAIYTELYKHGIGGFIASDVIWTSSEAGAGSGWVRAFVADTDFTTNSKNLPNKVWAIRKFTSTTSYALRSIGPSGGRIFWNSGNDYLEVAASSSGTSDWSNVLGVALGTTGTAIGTGQANTTAIMGQVGHTTSAAKVCNDLVV